MFRSYLWVVENVTPIFKHVLITYCNNVILDRDNNVIRTTNKFNFRLYSTLIYLVIFQTKLDTSITDIIA